MLARIFFLLVDQELYFYHWGNYEKGRTITKKITKLNNLCLNSDMPLIEMCKKSHCMREYNQVKKELGKEDK